VSKFIKPFLPLIVAVFLVLSGVAIAEAPGSATLRGHVADPTGAMIPGAEVTVTTTQGQNGVKTTTDATGTYIVHGLPAGSYVIQIDSPGFATFVSTPVSLDATQTKSIDIKLSVEGETQQVEVEAGDSATVSTEASANTSAIVLKGDDLDALSDDPDELQNELTALAGPSAGPNGGQIYIDGFTGGTLPPKSAIREIRINSNPYSAEFDRLGYGRIEILTKPGTDAFHGRAFLMGNDDVFNTGNPFTKIIPAYHSIQYNGTVSGSLNKNASYNISLEGRDNSDANIYTAKTAVLSGGVYVPTTISGGLFAPSNRVEFTPRFDLQLGKNNTLTVRYQFERGTSSGNIGNNSLPTQNSSSSSSENSVQITDSIILNDHMVDEIRFQWRRADSSSNPTPTATALVAAGSPTAPTISVPSYFSGGASGGQTSSTHNDHLELQEYLTLSHNTQAIKIGAWLRDNRQATSSSSGYNGSFSFPTINAYIDTLNGMAAGQTISQIGAACTDPQGCTPNSLTYTTGPLGYSGNVYDMALFIQDDWKFNKFLTLSGGLRWESQNHIPDHFADFAPRVAFAYALDGHKKGTATKTVIRGGFGFFYDRFGLNNLLNLEQFGFNSNGKSQYSITKPTCFDPNSLAAALAQGCSSTTVAASTPVKYTITPGYRSPYAMPAGLSLERQLTKTTTLTLTYVHYFGVHQMVTRDANAYLPGTFQYGSSTLTGTRPTSYPGIINQYFPEGVYKQNQLIVNTSARISPKLTLNGFFNYSSAHSDANGNPSNSWNLSQDYGRAGFVRPFQVTLMSSYTGPWGLAFNPFLVYQAGRPYNISVNNDLTGDRYYNDRPSFATSATPAVDLIQTAFGALDAVPQPGETLLPVNYATGPSAVAFNLRVSRSVGIGPKVELTAAQQAAAQRRAGGLGGGGFAGAGGGGGGRGGAGGGGGGGGFAGGGGAARGGMSGTGRKYSLNFNLQVQNLFNNINYGNPSGSIQPTCISSATVCQNTPTAAQYGPGSRFGVSTSLAGGMFASPSNSAARRIYAQATFQF
jgi:uncharacterized membrane protein YgcG